MNVLPFAAMLLVWAGASFAQDADRLWQFVDDEKKDSPQMQQQIQRSAKEIARLLQETTGEGEGEGGSVKEDNTFEARGAAIAGLSGEWFTAPTSGMTCNAVCASHSLAFDRTSSRHTGNAAGMHFYPDHFDESSNFASIECSFPTDKFNLGADGSTPNGEFSYPDCLVNCACMQAAPTPAPATTLAPPAISFTYFKFTATKLRNDGTANSIQISEFRFRNGNVLLKMEGVTVTNPGGNNPATQGPERLIDGHTSTKWLDFHRQAVIVKFPIEVHVSEFSFTTANDADERDPVSWRIEVSADGLSWTPVYQANDFATPTARFTETPAFMLAPMVPCESLTTEGSCPTGRCLWKDSSCQACAFNCNSCNTNGEGKCDDCKSGFVLSDTKLCEACASNCNSCNTNGEGKCDDCKSGFVLSDTNLCEVSVVDKGASGCTASSPCGQCEGDCDSDSECAGSLKCYKRTSSTQVVPGCATTGYVKSTSDHDYCYVHEAVCMWRQTRDCSPTGSREPNNDKTCTDPIPVGHSGFCDCDGDGVQDSSEPGYDCSSSPGVCNDVCLACSSYTTSDTCPPSRCSWSGSACEVGCVSVSTSSWLFVNGDYIVDGTIDGVNSYRQAGTAYTITRRDDSWWIDYNHGGSPYHSVESDLSDPPFFGWGNDGAHDASARPPTLRFCEACSSYTTSDTCPPSRCSWSGSTCEECSSLTTSGACAQCSGYDWTGSACQIAPTHMPTRAQPTPSLPATTPATTTNVELIDASDRNGPAIQGMLAILMPMVWL